MPEETKKETPVTSVAAQVEEDAKKVIKAQDEHLKLAAARIKELEKELQAANKKVTELEKKAKDTKAPAAQDGVVHLDGKSWKIHRTVRAKNALEEVKRGYIPEDASLIVTDRTE